MAWSSAGQSNAPSSSQSKSNESTGGWGSSSYASANSSHMSGGYRSDGGSSSGSGSNAPSSGASGSSGSGSSGSGNAQSVSRSTDNISSKVDSKGYQSGGGQLAGWSGQSQPNGAVTSQFDNGSASFWSDSSKSWQTNPGYTKGERGEFGSEQHLKSLDAKATAGKLSAGEAYTGRAMIEGKQNAQGQGVLSGMTRTAGTAMAGPAGGLAGAGVGYGFGKLQDAMSKYGDSPAYNTSKQLTKDDSSLIGTAAGWAMPGATGGIAQAAINDRLGEYSQGINQLERSMQAGGYINNQRKQSVQMNGSNNANGLLNTMFAQRQVTQPDTENSIAALNYGNFTPSYGSVI